MLPDYKDIRRRIDEEPLWFTEEGVPRYDRFDPALLGVYDRYAGLFRIQCQSCNQRFLVGAGRKNFVLWGPDAPCRFEFEPWARQYHYGDPPRHGGCAGETMSCDDLECVEAWEHVHFDWVRRPDLEGWIGD